MSKELPKTYDHSDVESRLYEKWEKKGYFHAEANPEKKPYCIVMPPPNITGKLHMGHALDNTLPGLDSRRGRHGSRSGIYDNGHSAYLQAGVL